MALSSDPNEMVHHKICRMDQCSLKKGWPMFMVYNVFSTLDGTLYDIPYSTFLAPCALNFFRVAAKF